MIRLRILTAVVLLAVFFPALFWAPAWAWALGTTLIVGLAAWEWAGLMKLGAVARWVYGGTLASLCIVLCLSVPDFVTTGPLQQGQAAHFATSIYGVALLFWLVLVPCWFRARWALPGSLAGFLIGAVVIVPTWMAMVQLRQVSPLLLLSAMAAVWVADIAAYFFGCAYGRHKLAPTISPNKSWEGALAGAVAVMIFGTAVWALSAGTASSSMVSGVPLPVRLLALLGFAGLSIVGDLFESMLKRQAGIKDSSGLLPGHGGVLDRIDSLTSTLPLVACATLLLT